MLHFRYFSSLSSSLPDCLFVCLFVYILYDMIAVIISRRVVSVFSIFIAFDVVTNISPKSGRHCGPRKGLIRVLLKGGPRRTSKPILQFMAPRPAAHFTVHGKGIFQDGGYYKSHRSSFCYSFTLEKEMNVRRVKEESKREPYL